jgi:putative toxin-antitoxin system antitoxin component (TIGR02293 family)
MSYREVIMTVVITKKSRELTNKREGIWSIFFPIPEKNYEPDSMKLIKVIREGVPGDLIIKFAEHLRVPKNDLYSILHLNARTAQRFVAKRLDVDKSDRLVQIAKVYERCLNVFEDFEKAMHWLKSPNYALGNQIPWDLLDTTEGSELVLDTLGRIEYGVFI